MQINSTKNVSHQHLQVLVYGESGSGKTFLASTASKPLVIAAEQGVLSLQKFDIHFVHCPDLNTLKQLTLELANPEVAKQYDTVWVDSLTVLADMALSEIEQHEKDPRKSYPALVQKVKKILAAFAALKMDVVFVAHAALQEDALTGTSRIRPRFPGQQLAQQLPHMLDAVFYLSVQKRKNEAGEWVDTRVMQTAGNSTTALAKDRSGNLAPYEQPHMGNIFKKMHSLGDKK